MPKVTVIPTEEEMRACVKTLKENKELSVTRVRELLKVGYTKARRLLDEAMAGETYIPPVEVPESTNDESVLKYIQQLIGEGREVKPDILRRDLNIGYKRAKRLIDSLGGNRAGVTVIPPIARKPRISKKNKSMQAGQIKIVVAKPRSTKRAVDDAEAAVLQENKRRRTGEKKVAVRDLLVEEDDDEDEDEDEEDEDYTARKPRHTHKIKHLLDGIVSTDPQQMYNPISATSVVVKAHEEKAKPAEHDHDHAHIMLMLHEGEMQGAPDEAEKTHREHHHHHNGHHSHGHHSHHHGHHSHHHSHHRDTEHHHSHGHGHHSSHGHHHHSHHRDGHHSHHSHHGHGHHHGHHSHHSHHSERHHRSKMSIAAISDTEDHHHAAPHKPIIDVQPLALPPASSFNTDWMSELCLPGCGRLDASVLCTDMCVQPVSGVEQFSLA